MTKFNTIFLFFLMSTFTAWGQLTYPVNVVNNEFQPDSITITQGDGISWECSEGFHNVDGSLDTYPDNPEGFYSGNPQGAPWTYTFTFTAPGVYNYRCEVHSTVMTGKIVVADVSTPTSEGDAQPIDLFPNPTKDFIRIEGVSKIQGAITLSIYDITGKTVFEKNLNGQNTLDLSKLKEGIYLYNLSADNELIQTGKIARN
jgi:plastocyanin